MSSSTATAPSASGLSRLWRRELNAYPKMGPRMVSLAIVVLTTCLFYYQYYLISSVSLKVMEDTGMSFTYFVNVNVISLLVSAAASAFAGITDRVGRANLIVVGVLGCALVCLFALPNVHSQLAVLIWYSILGGLEGIVLVATPALVRDFSPQLGRASAMGFWTIGPVAGSLVATAVVSNVHDKSWQDQYTISGIAGLVVFVLALLFLRELSPALRDQIMVSEKDREVLEARARGIDVQAGQKHPMRQMLHINIVGSALAISLLLFIYFAAVSFFPVYFQTLFDYSESKANSVLTWMWAWQVGALIIIGFLSDRLRVRKPFMLVGGIGAIVMTVILIQLTGEHPSFNTFALVLSLLALFLGMAFAPWMASYTETVEDRNPALTATGLSVWGLMIRTVAALAVLLAPMVVSTVTTLVQDGPHAKELAAKYASEIEAAGKLQPATQEALGANPADQATQAQAVSEISGVPVADVAKVMTLSVQDAKEIATAQVLDPAVQVALLTNPNDTEAQAKAVQQIMAGLHVSATEAAAALDALSKVPTADLLFLQTNAAKVQTAGDQLQALAKVPPADLAYMAANGAKVQAAGDQLQALAKVPPADLNYLQTTGTKVQQAKDDSPNEWKHYLWIAVGGEVVFLPLIFLMSGYWSPRKAKKAAEEHAAKIAAEAAKLA